MKKILGIFALAVMVTVGSAFTAEDAFVGTIISRATPTGTWSPGGSGVCGTGGPACRVEIAEVVAPSHYQTIGNAAPAAPATSYQVLNVDHDNDSNTATITVNVTVLSRFNP